MTTYDASHPATSVPAEDGAGHDAHDAHDGHHAHPPHLAHHFDTPTQQYASGKLGMWVFLGTEILMFGGLFVAYAVYRYNHPEVFEYASQALNTPLGLTNTVVLISSSLTMALAIHFIQKGNQKATMLCLLLTLAGGFGFMGIKSVEYYEKLSKNIFVGSQNIYSSNYAGDAHHDEGSGDGHGDEASAGVHAEDADHEGDGADHGDGYGGDAASVPTPMADGGPRGQVEGLDTAAPMDAVDGVGGVGIDENQGVDQKTVAQVKGGAQATENVEAAEDVANVGESMGEPITAAEQRESGMAVAEQPVTDPAVFGIEYADPNAGSGDAAQIVPQLAAQAVGTVDAVRDGEGHFYGNHNAYEQRFDAVERPALPGEAHTPHGEHIELGDLPPRDRERVASFYGIYYAMTGLHGLHVLIGMGLITWVAVKTAAGVFGPSYFTPVDLVGLYWHLVDLIWIFLFPLLYLM